MLVDNGDFSNMLGWISIACWIVVYSPQIYENYSLQSGEGLSVLFVIVWLFGDLCNLFGALLANLLPTVIIIALYYSICDIILMFQIYYYRWKRGRSAGVDEETPLLTGNTSQNSQTPVSAAVLILRYTGAVLFVFATGILAWWINSKTEKTEEHPKHPPTAAVQWIIQILGWTSAVSYLSARVPQIAKNLRTRCEGLSPALFYFAILGNVTYSWSIIAKSTDRDYLITNASWLAGSALTVFLDLIVLGQFFYYRPPRMV
ncbi:PQ loop repeat-domain-containing protein [Mycena maculata]|uniref:PQ loop repeat-domain-containing protein n=1 Tax=Mycena maculata TaxID=230809 RepID=A0AAD7NI13_9AGAR|nr:PQ loop repeat-domain-containing protein [Mycena maculata]